MKRKLTSYAVALGVGLLLSPVAAGAQEQPGTQPGTETPVESDGATSGEDTQPGTEAQAPVVADDVQPGTEAQAPAAGDAQPGTETPVESDGATSGEDTQPGTEAQAPVVADDVQPGTEAQAPAAGDAQPGTETPVESDEATLNAGAQADTEVQAPVEASESVLVETVGADEPEPVEPEPAESTALAQQAPVREEYTLTENNTASADSQSETEPDAAADEQSAITQEDLLDSAPSGVDAAESPDAGNAAETPVSAPANEASNQTSISEGNIPAQQPVPSTEGIAGANLTASGYGQNLDVEVETATRAVNANVAGTTIETSPESGVVVDGRLVVSSEQVNAINTGTARAFEKLPPQAKVVTDSINDTVQNKLADLPDQQEFSAAGVTGELTVDHWA